MWEELKRGPRTQLAFQSLFDLPPRPTGVSFKTFYGLMARYFRLFWPLGRPTQGEERPSPLRTVSNCFKQNSNQNWQFVEAYHHIAHSLDSRCHRSRPYRYSGPPHTARCSNIPCDRTDSHCICPQPNLQTGALYVTVKELVFLWACVEINLMCGQLSCVFEGGNFRRVTDANNS